MYTCSYYMYVNFEWNIVLVNMFISYSTGHKSWVFSKIGNLLLISSRWVLLFRPMWNVSGGICSSKQEANILIILKTTSSLYLLLITCSHPLFTRIAPNWSVFFLLRLLLTSEKAQLRLCKISFPHSHTHRNTQNMVCVHTHTPCKHMPQFPLALFYVMFHFTSPKVPSVVSVLRSICSVPGWHTWTTSLSISLIHLPAPAARRAHTDTLAVGFELRSWERLLSFPASLQLWTHVGLIVCTLILSRILGFSICVQDFSLRLSLHCVLTALTSNGVLSNILTTLSNHFKVSA